MPIFRVTYEVEVVVEAENLRAVEDAAMDVWKREVSYFEDPGVTNIAPVKTLSHLPYGWDGKCFPFNSDGSRRLEELLPEDDRA